LTRMLSQNVAGLNAENIYLSAYEHQGKTFVYFGMGNSSNLVADYIYCLESGEWVEAGYPYLMKFSEGLNAIALNSTSGIIYSADPLTPTYQDVGSASYTARIQTSLCELQHRKNGGHDLHVQRSLGVWFLSQTFFQDRAFSQYPFQSRSP
jgi:hypothetical protein